MHDTFKQLITNQYQASLCTLNQCIQECPEAIFQKPVAAFPFSQCVFHTLFFADLYLGKDMDDQLKQQFHLDQAAVFAGYSQLESDTPAANYQKPFLSLYLQHCRSKMERVVGEETEADLNEPAGFPWLSTITRAEVHAYNIRHIQHHAAQLILQMRKEATFNLPWVRSGWV